MLDALQVDIHNSTQQLGLKVQARDREACYLWEVNAALAPLVQVALQEKGQQQAQAPALVPLGPLRQQA